MDKKNSAIIMLSIIVMVLSTTLVVVLGTDVDTNSAEMEKIIGKWTPYVRLLKLYTSYEFKEDGTFIYREEWKPSPENRIEIRNGTYQVQDGKLILKFENSEIIVYRYIFSENNSSVILINTGLLDEVFNFEDSPEISRYTWFKE